MHAFGDGDSRELLQLDCHLTGFPGLKNDIYTEKSKIKKLNMQEIILYEYYTERGNSGSPIWYKSGDQYFVVGIHIETGDPYRKGCRLSLKNSNILYKKRILYSENFMKLKLNVLFLAKSRDLKRKKGYENSLYNK